MRRNFSYATIAALLGLDETDQLAILDAALGAGAPVTIGALPGDDPARRDAVTALLGADLLTEDGATVAPTQAAIHYDELCAG